MNNIRKLKTEQLINIELKNGGVANLQKQAEQELDKVKRLLEVLKEYNIQKLNNESSKKFCHNIQTRIDELVETYNMLIEAIEKHG